MEQFEIPGTAVVDERGLCALAEQFALQLELPCVVYLNGELGAGKTTFARALLLALGVSGSVKSPTYTLVESYPLAVGTICHFDLYRLEDPEELEFIGFRDVVDEAALALFEWPQRGQGQVPEADWLVELEYAEELRRISVVPSKNTR